MEQMIDREKVIKGLECIVSSGHDGMKDDCANCIYSGGGDCLAPALRDALALLKAQEPRVLTLDEAKSLKYNTVVWYDYNGQSRTSPYIVDGANDRYITFIDCGTSWFGDNGYGKRWRLWSAKPTKEQREGTAWDD